MSGNISQILIYSLVAFLSGVAARSFLTIPVWLLWMGLVLGVSSLVILSKNSMVRMLFFFILFFCFGIFITSRQYEKIYDRPEGKWSGMVRVDSLVREKNDKVQFVAVVVSGKENNSEIRLLAEEKLQLFAPLYPEVNYGEYLEVECRVRNPVFENQPQSDFDYRMYLAEKGIYQTCMQTKILSIVADAGKELKFTEKIKINFFQWIYKFSGEFERMVYLVFPQPEAGYVAGLLVGGDDRLPEKLQEAFIRSGTAHTVAVSGYNITIIAEYVLLFFINAGLWRKNASRVASVFIIIFVLMIGAPSSAVRAAIMALLTMWAARNSRISDSLRALIFAVTLMVLLSPLALRYDTGLQLSFLAAAGLILFQSKLEALFPWVTARWELRATLASTLSAQFGVLGILIYSFHTLSPISLVVNLMILPLIPLLMLGGFLAVVLGFIWLPMAQWLSIPLYLVLQLQLKSILWSASFPWAQVNIGKIWNWWVVGYYGLAGYWGRMRG